MTRAELEQLLQYEIEKINHPLVLKPVTVTKHSNELWDARSNGDRPVDYIAIQVNPRYKEVLGTQWVLNVPNSRDDGPTLLRGMSNRILRFLGKKDST